MRDKEGVWCGGPKWDERSCVSVRQKTLIAVEYYFNLLEQDRLPSKPGGGRRRLVVTSITKIVVSHLPVGHSLLGGEANSFWGGVTPG